jgi:3-dehydroquinate synthase class II
VKPGDEVLVHVAAKGGRHFGISVSEEKVIER